jgi:hypothetical protein
MTDTDIALAKKRLARDLKIGVLIQVVALCIFGVGWWGYFGNLVPNYPQWDKIHSLCGWLTYFGAVVCIGTAFWGSRLIMDVAYLPTWTRIYAGSVWAYIPFALCANIFFYTGTTLIILLSMYPFYCLIPQFFIARWLAKEAKDGTMACNENCIREQPD